MQALVLCEPWDLHRATLAFVMPSPRTIPGNERNSHQAATLRQLGLFWLLCHHDLLELELHVGLEPTIACLPSRCPAIWACVAHGAPSRIETSTRAYEARPGAYMGHETGAAPDIEVDMLGYKARLGACAQLEMEQVTRVELAHPALATPALTIEISPANW